MKMAPNSSDITQTANYKKADDIIETKQISPPANVIPSFSISSNPTNGSFMLQTGTTEQSEIIIYDVLVSNKSNLRD